MSRKANKKTYMKLALLLSLVLMIMWMALGAGASLAWFTDTSEEITNIFHFGDFELEVSHRLEDGSWEPIDGKTDIFDNEALYEPGFVQVVYLRVENTGDYPFNFSTAVSVTDYTIATNVFGQSFNVQDHLLFGLTTSKTEADMDASVETRDMAETVATTKLMKNYSTEVAFLDAGETAYIALVVCMPEEVGNEANYRGEDIPRVELGIIVKAEQLKN